jgi:hypothetical protein
MSEKSIPIIPLWSKIGARNTPPTQTPPTTEPAVNTPVKKGTLVLKPIISSCTGAGNSNGFSPLNKHRRWADYDDEDELVPRPAADPRASRIDELEDIVAQKTARVNELEKEMKAKVTRIDTLERNLEEKVALIAELKETNKIQEYNLRQYVGEVDENDRRIAQLEIEIEEQVTYIHELELQVEIQSAEPSVSDPLSPATAVEYSASKHANSNHTPSKQATNEDSTVQVGPGDTAFEESTPGEVMIEEPFIEEPLIEENTTGDGAEQPRTEHLAEQPTAEVISTDTYETTFVELSPEEYPVLTPTKATNDAGAPETNTPADKSCFVAPRGPIFVTPQTLKQAPPVPPAPVLKMGLDMSNWGKKSASKPGYMSHAKGYLPKRTIDSTVVPTINPSRDVRKMTRFERGALGNGGDVEVKMGKQGLGKVPKYMLMQCSYVANKHFSENPKAAFITFPVGSMDVAAVNVHLDWMRQLCSLGKVYSIALNPEHDDVRNMNIVRAARVLGLNNTYVGHFTKQYCDKIRGYGLTWEIMELIAALFHPDNDPIFDCLANNIASQRRNDNVVDPNAMQTFLQKYPALAHRIDQIEHQHTPARKVRHTRR